MKHISIPHRRRSCSLQVEELERRETPASATFAVIDGTLASAAGDTLTINVARGDFQLPRGHVALRFEAMDDFGNQLSLGQFAASQGRVRRQSHRPTGSLVELSAGQFQFVVGTGAAAGQNYRVEVSLVGDVNGDKRVSAVDLRLITRQLPDGPFQRARHRLADVNGDGRVRMNDLLLAGRNLRTGTMVRPLALDLDAQQVHTTSHLATLLGRTRPGSMVSFAGALGQLGVGAADGNGLTRVFDLVPLGTTTLRATATDRFGQRVRDVVNVTRTALSNYFAAGFGPYVKQWASGATMPPFFDSYGSGNASVHNQVFLVAPTFSSLATYTSGHAEYYPPERPWNMVDSAWMVGPEAANYNQMQGSRALTVSQGIFQRPDGSGLFNPIMTAEIEGAFSIAQNANAAFNGTVNRLIFTNEYVHDATTITQVDQLINQYKDRAHQMGLTVGVRSENFGDLNNPASPHLAQLQQLVRDVDFIMINTYPSNVTNTIQQGVNEVTGAFASIKAAALALNPKIEVLIGETGWPTFGVPFNLQPQPANYPANPDDPASYPYATPALAQQFYEAIQTWANANQVEAHYFAAIDEPWKSNQNQLTAPLWKGKYGAEGHYGRWYYNTSDDSGQFVAKW